MAEWSESSCMLVDGNSVAAQRCAALECAGAMRLRMGPMELEPGGDGPGTKTGGT